MPKQILKNHWALGPVLFLIAGVSSATAAQTYGVPTGTLTVTTFEAPLLQTRNTKSYTVSSYASYAPGAKKDPQGAVGVNRSFQQRYPNNVYGAIIPIPINSKDWPANSGIDKTRTYGPYTPGDFAPVPESYGMETINLVFIDGNGISHALDTKQIYVYPASATAVLYLALPPSTALATVNSVPYQGDPPRVRVDLTNVYPSGQSWIVIYQGNHQGTNPPTSPVIPNTTNTASSTDIANYTGVSGSMYIDLRNLSLSSSTYTIQVYQQTAAYGLELVNNYATFTVNPAFQINAVVGTSK
jgi:hypothetical protein